MTEQAVKLGSRGVLVVGASVAGVRVARDLRRHGFDGRITIAGAEESLPYDKPPLSKQYLAGTFDTARLSLIEPSELEALRLDLRLGAKAVSLSAHDRIVVDDAGRELAYDVCVVATGASARPSPWGGGERVHLLRTLGDSARLKAAITPGARVVVIGAGLIGSEVASTSAKLGGQVTVIDPLRSPMAKLAGEDLAGVIESAHARHGVRAHFGVGVAGLSDDSQSVTVRLTTSEEIEADLAVVGIGVSTNDAWLAGSGAETGQGVECDEYGRVVGLAGVYAAGDVARWPRPPLGIPQRVEHWTNAVEQAATVAYNIVHQDSPVANKPTDYMWSDQYDLKLQVVGWPALSTLHCVIGEPSALPPRFAALFADDRNALSAAVTVNWPRALAECRRLLDESADVVAARDRLEALHRPAPSQLSS